MTKAKAFMKRIAAVLLTLMMAIGMIPASLGVNAASSGDTVVVDHFQTIGNNYIIQPYIQGLPAGSRFVQYQGVYHDEFNIAYVSVNGGAPQMAYCLEYGVDLHSGNRLSGSSTYDSLNQQQKTYIALATMFGYNDLTSTNPNWQFYSYGWDAAMATQIMIWQIVEGTFDYSTSDVAGVEAEVMHSLSACSNNVPSSVVDVYRALKILVMQSRSYPQCAGNRPSTSPSYTLSWNAANNRYETVVNDPSGMLAYYDFTANGLMHQRLSDTQMLVWTDQPTLQNVVSTGTSNLVAWGTHLNGCFWELVPDFWESSTVQDLVTVHQGDADPVQCYMRFSVEAQGSVRIVKTAEDGNIAGIRMNISGNGVNQDVTTGPDGSVQVNGLTPGTYTVTEYPSDNYVPQDPQEVTVVSGQTATVTFNNTLKRGTLSVTKTSEDGLVEGITFQLTGTSNSGQEVNVTAVTDAAGVATFQNILIGSGYTLTEADTGIQYVVPEDQTATINWNEVTNATFNNTLKKWTATVVKVDAETGAVAQGDGSLAGAVYGVYKDGQLVDSYVTDANGSFTTEEYICGIGWTIQEIEPSPGYLLDETVHQVGAEPQNYTIEHNVISMTMTENPIKGTVSIVKHAGDADDQGQDTPEDGAVFQIYLTSAGSYDAAKESERDTLTTDEAGFAQSKQLPYGTYTVHQVSGWEGTLMVDDFNVIIDENGRNYPFLLNNPWFETYLRVEKVDAETGNAIAYAGAEFQIYDASGNLVTMSYTYPTPTTIDTFVTNNEGYLITPEPLQYGNYTLVETKAPYGYVLDSTPIPFSINEGNATMDNALLITKVVKSDMAQKGTITVTKTGEIFTSVNQSGEVYQPVWATGNLSGATFTVTAAEDIITPDGTLRYAAGTVVDTITTGSNGTATSIPLYLGRYNVVETQTPEGMIANDTVYSVELTYAGQDVEITNTDLTVDNDRQTVKVDLTKAMERDETFGLGDNDEILSVQFGLYAAEDIVAADGTVIPEDGLIEIVSVNEDGSASFASDLPFGSYYVKEIATDEHYILDGTEHPFEFTYAGPDTEVVHIDLGEFENDLIRGTISGLKINRETEEPVAGAVFGLFAADETEFTAENSLVDPVTSDENGLFEFTNIPFGNYIVRELSPAPGYLPNETNYSVTVEEDEQVIEIEVVNDWIPELGTTATVDNGKEIHPFETVTLTDVVSYKHLVPGQEYTIEGILMDKATGKPFLDADGNEVTAETTFIPEDFSGEVEVTFVFDASNITVNTDLVVFESLYKDDVELAVHADIDDEDQTITVKVPDIHTTATIGGNKDATAGGTITIEDVVEYTDLIPGKTYTMQGVLMNKATGQPFLVNGQEIHSAVVFVPEEANGSVIMSFTFDSSAINADTEIVVFEDLYQNDILLATHADINDMDQTVTIHAPVPKTGDTSMPFVAVAGSIAAASLLAGAGAIVFYRKRKEDNAE